MYGTSDFATEQIVGRNVHVSMAQQLLTSSQQVTLSISGNDMLFSPRSYTCMRISYDIYYNNVLILMCVINNSRYESHQVLELAQYAIPSFLLG